MKQKIFFFLTTVFFSLLMNAQPNTEVQKLLASNGLASDYFGICVSISGNYAIIGSNWKDTYANNSGVAYIFYNNLGTWEEVAILRPSNPIANQNFGFSVSISGNYAVVGAYGDKVGTISSGAAYIFEKPAGGWTDMTETARLTPTDLTAGNNFGWSVSVSDTNIVVGQFTNWYNTAYLYEKPAGGWTDMTETVRLTPSDGETFDGFASSVSISGNNVVVGSRKDKISSVATGSAYLFTKPVSGWANMTETAKFTASDGAADDSFGMSVNISDNYIIVGANTADNPGIDAGAAYLFEKPVSGWESATETAKFTPSDINAADYFGYSVGVSGDYVLVSSFEDDDNGSASGSVYLFVKPTSGWSDMSETLKLTASDGAASDYFGKSVSIFGDNAIISSYNDDDLGSNSGSVYLFSSLLPHISTQPVDNINICPASNVFFSVSGYNTDTYKWQLSVDNGNSFNDIPEGGIYSNTASDNLQISNVSVSMNNYIYRCTLTNIHGSVNSKNAVIILDNENPLITSIHNGITTNADLNCEAFLGDYTGDIIATDNCDTDLTVTQNPIPGTTISGNTNTVTLTVTDDLGNADFVTFNVDVIDVTDPFITSTHNDITTNADLNCEAFLGDYTGDIIATDNCDTDLTVTQNPIPGITISGNTNNITLTVTDDLGNADFVTFNVDVIDVTDPEIICIDNQTVNADNTNTYSVSGTEFDPLTINDNCNIASVINDLNNIETLDGAVLPQGTTTIVWTVIDEANNSNTCMFDVSVNSYIGVSILSTPEISIYPNPSKGLFTINTDADYKVTISNISGKTIKEYFVNNHTLNINLKEIKSGIYFINFRNNSTVLTEKIIIK
ncbi:MAG: T9SS type A sorting domain-containing protein [Bacteroidales bacterium]|nr:T9SS type A sorting domain-containing protein [Bacteroidales bacterium]